MIKWFDPVKLGWKVPKVVDSPPGWAPTTFGGLKAAHFTSATHTERAAAVHESPRPSISESIFEISVLLSVLQSLPGPEMTFVELGAGWGCQTLNVATAVRNQVVDMPVHHLRAYGVEAEPGHYRFLCETIQVNELDCVPIFAGISEQEGWAPFYSEVPPNENYGQSIRPSGNLRIPTITIEYLVKWFKIEEIDLLHMDVQGEEPQVVRGALPVIDRIRFLLICPHYDEHVEEIVKALEPTHICHLSFGPRSGYHELPGFPLPVHIPQDGIMLWERRE